MIALIDYEAGNIKSVENALKFLGQEAVLTRDRDRIWKADKVILPGVGAFGDAMDRIRDYDLEDVIHSVTDRGTPFLGICLGLQLLFEESEESPGAKGLGILPGRIIRIPEGEGRKVPQIGWNDLTYPKKGRLFEDVPEGSYVYFVHSYYLHADDRDIVAAQTQYGVTIDASVEKDNVFACQFHPEKSERVGMQILRNFVRL
ncbi:MAG: imidazole glycerol phosphate synthase subunit HisH [Lachnospiraceae bacterium]|jgi:glutamine amidotransferase|nr:imidazole glycerol phosphate synthase subunit HisH [Lachnospiraceae bacterium]